MFDPGTAIAVVGGTSALGAIACGYKTVRAHLDIALHETLGAALRLAFDDVARETVPDRFVKLLRDLPEDPQ